MKKFTKILCVCSAALLMLSAVGCGKKNDPGAGGDKTLYVASFKGAYGDKFWDDIKAGFEETYKAEGYKIRKVESSQVIEDTIGPQIRNGNGPDVIYLPTGNQRALTETLIKSKAIEDISDVLDYVVPGENVKVKDKIMPGFLDNMSVKPYGVDKGAYMLPLFYAPFGLFYNKTLFNADGTDGKYKLPETWDDFYGLKAKLDAENEGKSGEDLRYLFAYPMATYMQDLIVSSIATNAGKDVLNQFINYENVYGNEKVVDVFNKIAEIEGKYLYPSSTDPATNYKDNQASVLHNKALFLPSGSWTPVEMEDYTPADGFEYGFMPGFAYEKGQTRYVATKLEQVYILKQSKKKDIAKKFIAYLYSDKSVETIAKYAKALVPTVNALSLAREKNYIDSVTLGMYDIYSNDGVEAISYAFAAASVEGVNWQETLCVNVNNVLTGKIGVDEWIQDIKVDATKLKNAIVK